ncbi:MAG: PLP-dependent aminotransferase family protein [Gemmatimonadota bacterium]|nr:PLP-dependent aminotransferase family protein [Gemmatimonadota bacterium]
MEWRDVYADRMDLIGDTAVIELLKLAERPDVLSFAGGLPDDATFPMEAMKEVAVQVFETHGSMSLQYGPTAGYTALREWIAGRMGPVEGVTATADDIIVTTGGIEAMDLIAKTLLNPGDVIVVEAPTYLTAFSVFRCYDVDFVAVDIDDEGMRVDLLEAQLSELERRGKRAKLIYTMPTFQNPGGVTMPLERRRKLVELADRYNIPILEDHAYAELYFEHAPPPSLKALNPDGVLFVSTFSKIFGPGIRLGWIAAPPPVIAQLCQAKLGSDQCSSTLGQRIVYEYGRQGLMDSQIVLSRALYQAKRDVTLDALAEHAPPGLAWTRPDGGFYVWLTAPEGIDSTAMLAWAVEHEKVAYVAGPSFYTDGRGANQFRLCYSFLDQSLIGEGISRVCRSVAHHVERRHRDRIGV